MRFTSWLAALGGGVVSTPEPPSGPLGGTANDPFKTIGPPPILKRTKEHSSFMLATHDFCLAFGSR